MNALPSLSILVQLTLEGVRIIFVQVASWEEVLQLLHFLRELVLELHYCPLQNFLVQLRYVMQASFRFLLIPESRK